MPGGIVGLPKQLSGLMGKKRQEEKPVLLAPNAKANALDEPLPETEHVAEGDRV
jgi:hypothetical protein